ncbi:hypothetical protein [Ekhidna sp.]|uniref:hypothetical protein n=1 Tax=Ekhidna sp. TaxID=2608089 RepID=UPI00329A517B
MKKNPHSLYTFLLLILSLSLIYSCKSDDTLLPDGEVLVISGDNQVGVKGEYLPEPIVIKVASRFRAENLIVENGQEGAGFLVTDNFSLDIGANVLDGNYEARIYLSLGCDLGNQTFEVIIRESSCFANPDCPILASVQINASASEPNTEWSRICNVSGLSTMINRNGTIYSVSQPFFGRESELIMSTDFINWTTLTTFTNQLIDINILSDGTFVALTNGDLMTSSDGINWQNKSEGLPFSEEFQQPGQLLAEDSVLFVGFHENAFSQWYRSRDLGENWEQLQTPLENYPIVRSVNGNLYGQSNTFSDEILQSTDFGNNWESIDYTGTITGSIQSILPDEDNNLLIVSHQTEIVSGPNQPGFARISSKLHLLNTTTLNLSEIDFNDEEESYISQIANYNGNIYVLSGGNIYISIDGTWQKIEGPVLNLPSIEGLTFASSLDYLFVNGLGEYLISGRTYTYSNFID